MDELDLKYELAYFDIADKNYSKEELKEQAENFLRNLIKTNEFVPEGEHRYLDPDEFPFREPISQQAIEFFVDVCGQLDLSKWDYIEYHYYRELVSTYNEIVLSSDVYNRKLCVNGKIYITDIWIKYFTNTDRIAIYFDIINNINNERKLILLNKVNDFIQMYNEISDGIYSECEKIPDNA